MTGNNWSQRITSRNSPQDLQDLRSAARDLSHEADHLPGRPGMVFQQVSQYVILASVAATASLAFYHLWKELCRSHDKAHSSHSPAPDDDRPRRQDHGAHSGGR
jgi:hypothetical protein